MSKYFGFFYILLTSLFAVNFAFAENIFISQYPDSPREGQEVSLTLQSEKYDLSVAKITWTVDNVEVDSGVGRKTLSIKASQNGLPQIVSVRVEQDGFDDDSTQKVVAANTNFILYEGVDSVVPLFYKGRRLPGKEGTVKVGFFSFKDGNIVGLGSGDSENYTWKINGETKNQLSGQNKIINNILSKITDQSLGVEILKTNRDGSVNSSQTNIPLQNPEVFVYKTDDKKLTKNILSDTEIGKTIALVVEPFFFSGSSKNDPNLVYTWKINDLEQSVSTPWSVLFTAKSDNSIKINLDLINSKKISQSASRGFTFKSK